jgi:hypothetical protein
LESEIADIKRRAESGEFDGVTVDINYHPDYHFPVSWSFTIYDEVERLVEVTTTVTTGGWGKSTEEVTKKYLSVEIKESHIDTQGGIQLTEFQPAASAP